MAKKTMSPGLAAGIGAASSLASGIIGQVFAKKNSQRALRQNKELSQFQYNQDVEMWNRQNAYNSPTEQMKRYQEAGLNPNMIYGSGSSSAGNATQMPKYNAPTAPQRENPKIDLGNTLQQYQQVKMQQAQINNMNANTENTIQRTTNGKVLGEILGIDKGTKSTYAESQPKILEQQSRQREQDILKSSQTITNLKAVAKNLGLDAQYKDWQVKNAGVSKEMAIGKLMEMISKALNIQNPFNINFKQ